MLTTILTVAIGLTILALILTIFWLLKASGLFTAVRIKIEKPTFEDLTLMYKFKRDDYSTSSEIFKDILNYSPSHCSIGIYYDKPENTPAEQRRFMVGMIVDQTKDQEIIERMRNEGYKHFQFPKSVQSVCTAFPFSSVFSLTIATMRVPSRLANFIETNKLIAYPMIEVYLPTVIHYFLPLSNHESYYVSEALSDVSKSIEEQIHD